MMAVNIEQQLTYEYVRQEFEDVGEDLDQDLSVVRVSMTCDVHTDSMDLEVCIYGQENSADDPPVVQTVYSGADLLQGEGILGKRAFYAKTVLSLFDQNLLDLFIRASIKIVWNDEDIICKQIDPGHDDNTDILFAQDQ